MFTGSDWRLSHSSSGFSSARSEASDASYAQVPLSKDEAPGPARTPAKAKAPAPKPKGARGKRDEEGDSAFADSASSASSPPSSIPDTSQRPSTSS